MAIQYSNTKIHWNYFVTLEQDFQIISRYIEPCEANNAVFSIELARIIMASTQEVDVVMKSLCRLLDTNSEASKISQYFAIVSHNIPEFISEEVRIPRFSMSSQPWSSWTENTPPLWWTANNKIKHHRSSEYQKATLKNAFNSLSALLIVTSYFYKKELEINGLNINWMDVTAELVPHSSLFRLNEDYYYGVVRAGKQEW